MRDGTFFVVVLSFLFLTLSAYTYPLLIKQGFSVTIILFLLLLILLSPLRKN